MGDQLMFIFKRVYGYAYGKQRRTRALLPLILFAALLLGQMAQAASGKLIDLDFKNSDLKDILRALASQAGVTFVIDNDVTGTVTLHLSKVTFGQALEILAKNNQLTYTVDNKVYHISQIDTSVLKVEYDAAAGLLTVEAERVKLFRLFETLSQKTGVNLVPAPELQDRIDIQLERAPLTDGIQAILTKANCIGETIGKVTYVRKKATELYPFTINYQNNLITIDAQNIPVSAVTRAITEKTGVAVVADPGVNSNVSIYIQNLPLAEALAILSDSNGLELTKLDNSWRISRKAGSFRVRFKDNLLSVDADNVDVTALTTEISRQTGVNIILAREIRGTASGHFQNVPLSQALNALLEPQGWVVERQYSSYYIKPNTGQNPNLQISYDPEKQLFDITVTQASPLTTILGEIARKADLNIVIMPQVNWNVNNLRLKGMNLSQTLGFLLQGTAYSCTVIDQTYIIADSLYPRPENSDFQTVKVYPVRYLKADQILSTLPAIFPRQNIVPLQDKNALVVTGTTELHSKFSEYLAQMDVASIEDQTEVIRIKYLKAEDILKYLPSSISKTDIIVIKEMNAVSVTGPQNLINQVKQYIDKIDQVNPMIVFDILVVSISASDTVTWDPGTASILTGTGGVSLTPGTGKIVTGVMDSSSILSSINLLISQNKAKVLQNPTIYTLNGYPTNFNVSKKVSYNIVENIGTGTSTTPTSRQVNFDSGLFITMTPWVSANGQITLEIKPTFSTFDPGGLTGTAATTGIIGTTNERTVAATVRMQDQETLVLGGLKSTNREKIISKIPILGDIPLLGFLFRTTTYRDVQDEFVILATPRLIYDEADKKAAQEKFEAALGPDTQNTLSNK